MIRLKWCCLVWISVLGVAGSLKAETMVLKATKDTFVRSNERNRNNGGSETLLVAHAPNVRSIFAFDLSGVTNRIVDAKLRFQQRNTMPDPIGLTVAALAQTKNNAAWGEGAGALGTKGQNSKPGEASYAWSAFPDVPWETITGIAAADLGDSRLWASSFLRDLKWEEGKWVEVKINAVLELEAIRASESRLFTVGLWGTSGNGLYSISSKESGKGPELILTLEEKKGGRK